MNNYEAIRKAGRMLSVNEIAKIRGVSNKAVWTSVQKDCFLHNITRMDGSHLMIYYGIVDEPCGPPLIKVSEEEQKKSLAKTKSKELDYYRNYYKKNKDWINQKAKDRRKAKSL